MIVSNSQSWVALMKYIFHGNEQLEKTKRSTITTSFAHASLKIAGKVWHESCRPPYYVHVLRKSPKFPLNVFPRSHPISITYLIRAHPSQASSKCESIRDFHRATFSCWYHHKHLPNWTWLNFLKVQILSHP